MQSSRDQEEEMKQESREKGGLKTLPFILANEVFENVATNGLQANLIIYLRNEYHMNSATAASVLFMRGAVADVIPIFGALLSDVYFGRYIVIAFASVTCLTGISLLWLTALLPSARPPACDFALNDCQSPKPPQLALLFSAFALMSIGTGGIKPCSIAFGADQLSQNSTSQKEKILQAYFNWYYASVGFSYIIALTVIVHIQDKMGWHVGFGVPVALVLLSTVLFLLGSCLYIKVKARRNLLTGLAQVIVVATKKRRLALPPETASGCYHQKKDSELITPTEKLRFLNKACMFTDPERDLNPDGSASDPWNLCTVEQVEDLKSAIWVLPIWSTGFMVSLANNQSFPVLQAATMDRHLGPGFEIPSGSFVVFSLIAFTLWSGCYDRFIVPLLKRVTRGPHGLTLKQRVGIRVMLSVASSVAAAAVEAARRRTATEQGLEDDAHGVVSMSAMWLVPQYGLAGLSEAFNSIGQIEFYYSELPKSMASLGVGLNLLGMGFGNLMGSLVIKLVDGISGKNGRVSWLSSNLNKGHYDYYYWILALLGLVNFFYYLACSWVYGEEGKKRGCEEEWGSRVREPVLA